MNGPEEWPPGTRLERDEILEAEVRDDLRDLGLDEDSVREAIATMRDEGMFDMPVDWTP